MLSQLRAGIDVACAVRGERSGGAEAHDAHPSRLDRRDEGLQAEDVDDPREIVGEHVRGHLGGVSQARYPCGRQSSCDQEPADRRATSPQRCGTPHAQAGGSTEPD